MDSLPVYRSRRAMTKGARHDCMGIAAGRRAQAGIAAGGCIADIDRNWVVGSSSPRHVFQLRDAHDDLRRDNVEGHPATRCCPRRGRRNSWQSADETTISVPITR